VWVLFAISLPRDRQGTAAGTKSPSRCRPEKTALIQEQCSPLLSKAPCRTLRKLYTCTSAVPWLHCRLRHRSGGSPVRPSRHARLTRLSRNHAARLWPSAASAARATAPQTSGGSSGAGSRFGVVAERFKARAVKSGPSAYRRLLGDICTQCTDRRQLSRSATKQP